ncbi:MULTISPECIES: phosphoglycolate phosphatase [unclassified Neptuniibacter]|uniref:phosphoglycolate phosphatase n=1 Tax=unclassified Neptuniibacter TaxID=2630693 RepID=UPI000C5C92A5|nr:MULTISPECIES: phosphoglycolate phosphatase [unclassified Neptuniibacter]MAY42489.1 phosphoglycolate phosphatase [Oceanospirillaceae bacterium]|tara:strand:- start:27111 stop:27788 length:678 start_codon:yes stop_codon:yes gene_type:complete
MKELFDGVNPELVMFDLDGTLVDSVPDLAVAIDRMLQALDRPLAGVGKVRNWVGNGAAVLVRRALADNMSVDAHEEELYEKGLSLFMAFYAKATADQSQLYPGALACLKLLKENRIKMGLVTNKPISFTRTMLDGFELTGFFEVILGGDSLAKKKPDPLPLQEIMRQCGVAADRALMVGDSISDVSAARAAGCAVACVPYGYNHGECISLSAPDLMVERLDHLLR